MSGSLESLRLSPPSLSLPIPYTKVPQGAHHIPPPALITPPYTPEHSGAGGGLGIVRDSETSAALDFLLALFPKGARSALPYAKSVNINSPALKSEWQGIVLELPGKPKTLYVHGSGAEQRESIVALLDLADEHLGCTAFVIALEKRSAALGNMLHSLMYVGGTIVTKPPFETDPAYLLVGIEI